MHSQKGFSTLIGILMVILFSLIGGGAIWVYYQYKVIPDLELKNNNAAINLPKNKVNNQTNNAAINETANWKTYRSEKYGFELKYPGSWKVNTEEPNVEIATIELNQYLHGVGMPPKGNAWIIFLPSLPQNFVKSETESQPGPGSDIIIQDKDTISSNGHTIWIIKGYWKGDSQATKFKEIFKQILSTFKFTQ